MALIELFVTVVFRVKRRPRITVAGYAHGAFTLVFFTMVRAVVAIAR